MDGFISTWGMIMKTKGKTKVQVIVAGSRVKMPNLTKSQKHLETKFYKTLVEIMGAIQEEYDIEIISGHCLNSADYLGELYAERKQLVYHVYPAQWDKWGHSAGYKRNEVMSRFGNILIAFWDMKSNGTRDMIDLAYAADLSLFVIDMNTGDLIDDIEHVIYEEDDDMPF